jgi:succinyl-CoA synthetase beta subunit
MYNVTFFDNWDFLPQVPLVVRLEGTNVDNAKKILADSNLKIESATDLDDAARKAVGMLH